MSTELSKSFSSIGIRSGPQAVLLVHSSLSAFGEVPGGADAVIDALLAALGGGTLVLPTLSYLFVLAESPEFDVASTPTNLGAIPSAGLKRAGAVRSLHPTHSCVAIGPRAAEVCGKHGEDRTPVGPNSPFTRVKELGGQVAFVGCPHLARCNTSMHGVEEAQPSGPPPYLLLPGTVAYTVKGADGVAEGQGHGGVDRVQPLRPVEAQPGDAALALDQKGFAHASAPWRAMKSSGWNSLVIRQ